MPQSIIHSLQDTLGTAKVLLGEAVRERYPHIWQMDIPLAAKAVLLPTSTEEISQIMKICHAHRQAVVMHGGLTNLVGSTETDPSEIVISLEKMNRIEEVDAQSRTITVQAGVILAHVQEAAAEQGLLFPLNFGAKGSAQMGGIIATNAGGLRVFRYGMTRQLVLGLEAVLADGTVISSMKKIIKDNSAYDLKQLFIGSEGTLGIVTRAVFKLVEAPKSRCSAIVGLDHYDKVVAFLRYMDAGLAGTMSGFELLLKPAYMALTSPPATVSSPLPYDYPYYVLLESLGSDQVQDQERIERLLEEALEQQIILDAVPAQSASEVQWFWTIREEVGIMVDHCVVEQQFDISLPIPLIGEVIAGILTDLENMAEVEQVYTFGHVADGNMHLIVGKQTDDPTLTKKINEVVYSPLQAIGGSVSAEHGIGIHKKAYLRLCRTPQELNLMKNLKQALDPFNLLNSGKILDT